MLLKNRWRFFLILAAMILGCQSANQQHDGTTSNAPSGSAAELTQQAAETVEEAKSTFQLLQSAGGSFRVKLLRNHIARGIQMADLAMEKAEGDEQILKQNCESKTSLLLLAVRYSPPDFEETLKEFSDSAWEEDPTSIQAEYARWAWLIWEHVEQESPTDEALEACAEYAEVHADSELAPQLYAACADRSFGRNDLDAATAIFQAAEQKFGDHEVVQEIRKRLKDIAAKKEMMLAQAKLRAKYIASFTGGALEGYFVVYSESNKYRTAMNGMQFKPVDYSVIHGGEKVAKYIQERRSSEWKSHVVNSFADTKEGKRRADAKCKELIEKNTKTYTVFN